MVTSPACDQQTQTWAFLPPCFLQQDLISPQLGGMCESQRPENIFIRKIFCCYSILGGFSINIRSSSVTVDNHLTLGSLDVKAKPGLVRPPVLPKPSGMPDNGSRSLDPSVIGAFLSLIKEEGAS